MKRRLGQRCQFLVIHVPYTKKDNNETKGAEDSNEIGGTTTAEEAKTDYLCGFIF